ncbi:MAG: gluconokinase [Pseudolabrys sp.]|jgi:carbohydrate kinase (thermoresistant glucokinase family)
MAKPHVADWTAALVVMGVSGAGKSTIAQALSARLGRPLIEGDSLHPPANIAKMSTGTPLTDGDRLPWLKAIAARIDDARKTRQPVIVTCSALKRPYREILTDGHDDVGFVYLRGTRDLIASRLDARTNHFMPPGLLDSQFAALQEPGDDEPTIAIAIDATPAQIVDKIVARFTP